MKKLFATILVSLAMISAPALADRFEFDKGHTKILFFIDHMGFSQSVGEFTDYDGHFVFDEKAPEKSSVEVTLKPAGIRTSSVKLDEHLQNADFFNVEKFPDVTFKSTAVKVTGENTGEVTGDATMLGVTKPVTMKVTFNKAGIHPYSKDYVAGFSAEATLKRSDFGMNYGIPNVGDEVRIEIYTEGISKDHKKAEEAKN
ncbi:MAG: YceI family protein [Rickettsiales bacterium]